MVCAYLPSFKNGTGRKVATTSSKSPGAVAISWIYSSTGGIQFVCMLVDWLEGRNVLSDLPAIHLL